MLKRISGRDNAEFKRFLAARSRRSPEVVLVEGPKLLDEAIRSRLVVRMVAVDEESAAISAFTHLPRVQFASARMKSLADVETHQGILALVERPGESREWLNANDAFILILDGLQDPGNVGTHCSAPPKPRASPAFCSLVVAPIRLPPKPCGPPRAPPSVCRMFPI